MGSINSSYLFKLADEKDALLTNVVKTIQSSNYLSVVDVIESESNKSVIDVSAQFPITLGLIDVNSSDTRIKITNRANITNIISQSIFINYSSR